MADNTNHRKPEDQCTGPKDKCGHVADNTKSPAYPHCSVTVCANFIGKCKWHSRRFGKL